LKPIPLVWWKISCSGIRRYGSRGGAASIKQRD
jgi:hypothetical protein